jgi:hypothetical protein
MGVGSASVVLIFAVLCLTVFALISLSTAANDKALTRNNANLVREYYRADTLAETILADILRDGVQEKVRGIEITSDFDMMTWEELISYSVPVNGTKVLYVEVQLGMDGAERLSWSMRDTRVWSGEEVYLPVWDGT